jgi:hypothetical protein
MNCERVDDNPLTNAGGEREQRLVKREEEMKETSKILSQYGLGVSPSEVTGELVRVLGTSTSAQGGNVRPKTSGRKKSTKSEAVPNELGSLHRTARSV